MCGGAWGDLDRSLSRLDDSAIYNNNIEFVKINCGDVVLPFFILSFPLEST